MGCFFWSHDIGGHFGGDYHVVHFWTLICLSLICLSLGILGENERKYLGPDLSGVGL